MRRRSKPSPDDTRSTRGGKPYDLTDGATYISDPVKREELIRKTLESDRPPGGIVVGDERLADSHRPFDPSRGAMTDQAKLDGEDVRTVSRAVRERFPMRDSTRIKVVDQLDKFLSDENEPTKDRIAAAKALISADKINLQEQLAADNERVVREFRQININNSGTQNVAAASPPTIIEATPIQIVYEDDWYGPNTIGAGIEAAEDAAASTEDPA